MSSLKTMINESRYLRNTLFIRPINVARALVRPKDITKNSVTISSPKCHFWYILTSHPMLVISQSHVNIKKVA